MRLIDADALIHEMEKGRAEALATAVTVSFDKPGEGLLCGLNMAEKIYASAMLAVYSAPTIDAVPVVRCKDCRWKEQEQPGMVYCPATVGGWVDEDWSCKGGETDD